MLNEFATSTRFVNTSALRTGHVLHEGKLSQEVVDLVYEGSRQRVLYAVTSRIWDRTNVINRRSSLSKYLPLLVAERDFELSQVKSTDRQLSED